MPIIPPDKIIMSDDNIFGADCIKRHARMAKTIPMIPQRFPFLAVFGEDNIRIELMMKNDDTKYKKLEKAIAFLFSFCLKHV